MKKFFVAAAWLSLSFAGISQVKEYTNPILAGFYPDPSICQAGDDYYLINSSFAYFPGLPVFHSRDLVNWKQIGHAMDRPSQLKLDGAGVSRGLFAPAITYHAGTFYIVCTLIDKLGNFVITAKNPAGPWSDPVPLPQVNGIDPSLFFDDDGKAYILFNSIPPGNISMHNGHRTIRMFEFDAAKLAVKGEEKLLVNGGTDMAKKPVWIEGPHIFRRNGWYYLICAEGGTGYNHSEVVFRSKNVEGPWESYEHNPILTQRHLDRGRSNPITTTGHADFVQAPDGNWHAVFLGCRPYEDDYYNTGRETFMIPVTWDNDWPVILKGNEEVKYKYPVPAPEITRKVSNPLSGNVHYFDDFNKPTLDLRWIFLRTVYEKWYSLSAKKGSLVLNVRAETISGRANPSFIAHRQQNLVCSAQTEINFNPVSAFEKAGITAFQNEKHFYFLAVTKDEATGNRIVGLYQSGQDSLQPALLSSASIPKEMKGAVGLEIRANKDKYSFFYSTAKNKWQPIGDEVDGKFLSTKQAGGFVGTVFGLYATGSGRSSSNIATFNFFRYTGGDEVFRSTKK